MLTKHVWIAACALTLAVGIAYSQVKVSGNLKVPPREEQSTLEKHEGRIRVLESKLDAMELRARQASETISKLQFALTAAEAKETKMASQINILAVTRNSDYSRATEAIKNLADLSDKFVNHTHGLHLDQMAATAIYSGSKFPYNLVYIHPSMKKGWGQTSTPLP